MKKITLNLFKGLLVIVLFTGVSVAVSTTGVQTVSEAHAGGGYNPASSSGQAGQVSASNVNQYLINHGYSVQSLCPITGTGNWQAYTVNSNGVQVRTIVYTQGSQIISSGDIAN